MATEERIQWVALPAGTDPNGDLLLSVFVAPRLRSDTGNTLARYPDFVDWPATLRATTWQVVMDGDPATAAPAATTGHAPDSPLWAAVFPSDTTVTPYEFDDYADRPLVTFNVGAVVDSLRRLYTSTAAASARDLPRRHSIPHTEPPVTGLDELLGEVGVVVDGPLWHIAEHGQDSLVVADLLARARERSRVRREAGPRGAKDPIEPLPPDGSPYERALFFHTRPVKDPTAMPQDGKHYRRTIDFHQSVSALGDHPQLMRLLGLVVDVRLPAGTLPPAPAGAPHTVRIIPTLPDLPAEAAAEVARVTVSHDTAYVLADVPADVQVQALFAAAPTAPDLAGPAGGLPTGLVPLPAENPAAVPLWGFRLEQLDVDGAAIKAINLAATIKLPASSGDETPMHHPDTAGLPALRSSGLALVHTGRAVVLQSDFARNLQVNAATEDGANAAAAVLYAEDLVLGHRLDIYDEHVARWFSTTARTETATAAGHPDQLPADDSEGFSQLSLTGAATAPGTPPDPAGELYVHETILTWDGWSLAAPRPGKSLSRDTRAPQDGVAATQPGRVPNDSHTTTGLSFTSTARAGTLPRLRFGRSYRVRLRAVDLAGNGIGQNRADTWLGQPNSAGLALPQDRPSPYLRFEPVPAPAVIPAVRYGEGSSALRLVVRSNGAGVAAWTAAFNAEHAQGGPDPLDAYSEQDQRHLAPPKASFELAERHGMFDTVIGAAGLSEQERRDVFTNVALRESGTFDNPKAPGAEAVHIKTERSHLENGEDDGNDDGHLQRYVIHRTPQLELPYLPDPLARGIALFNLPGRADNAPLTIEFAGPSWYQLRPVRLHLADGQGEPEWNAATGVLTVHLPQAERATIRVASLLGNLDVMAMRDWCERELKDAELDDVIGAMKENRCWLTTPWHTIELVHAVQQPLAPPRVKAFDITPRQLGATHVDLSGQVAGDWLSTEKIDLLASWAEPIDGPIPAVPPPDATTAVFDLAVATAERVSKNEASVDYAYALVNNELIVFNTAGKAEPGLPPAPLAHQFGDTKHRYVRYTIRATTPFREYFPLGWKDQPDLLSRDSKPQPKHILATAPPAPPAVLYAIPTLRWEDRNTDAATVRVRGGGGVRIWMDRGWWSSGVDEKLGVVIGPYLAGPENPIYHLMTFIGQDMTRGGGKVASPEPETFPNRTGTVPGVTLLEGPDGGRLATFEPAFDEGSGRWFCDIDIVTGDAYMPVVRLALVRYQPYAIDGCVVSRVVLVDIVQPLPDRTLTVTRPPASAAAGVVVAGPAYTSLAGLGNARNDDAVLAQMTCRIQTCAGPDAGNELAWVDAPGEPVVLTAAFDGPQATWSGNVDLPDVPEGSQRRLLVLEQERLPVDEQTPSDAGYIGRVVYAAHVPI